ncbi:hypothetical protein GCM10018980_30550 [Streptomyces capoamus]|uniref:Uncharacterized protein n=1 Tax=Streptomyces capoamus TaxID=68183 RepID=A0A919C405_9ACTN|nr:hypothetical protein GCM10010501_41040 [Streptomyces libani subsp. rufus]GHG49586.1 hypothetical protein GCM10018980_30550 [Streptomyces capoamus]
MAEEADETEAAEDAEPYDRPRPQPLLRSESRAFRRRRARPAARSTITTTARMMPANMAPPSFRSPEAAPRGRLA